MYRYFNQDFYQLFKPEVLHNKQEIDLMTS